MHANAHSAHDHDHHDTGGTKLLGFWIYLMSDCVLFASLFATYSPHQFYNFAVMQKGEEIYAFWYKKERVEHDLNK